MEKLSMEQIRELVAEAPGMIRKLASERDEYKSRCEELERHEAATKVASEMHRKGISTDLDHVTLTANLEKAAEQGKLDEIRAAVDMVGPDMGMKMAQLVNDEQRSATGSSDFERYLLTGVG